MTLDEARAYLRSRPMDLKAKEVLELLERMEGALEAWEDAVRVSPTMEGPYVAVINVKAQHAWRLTAAALTHSRLE
jgi:hypothetical protein